jgi:hypothetical protein
MTATTTTTIIITTQYRTERMPSSADGNPRYRLIIDGGEHDGCEIGTTRPDSPLAYGPVPNHEGALCKIRVHTTPSGRRYVEDVTPARDCAGATTKKGTLMDDETETIMLKGVAAAADVIGLPRCLDAMCQGEVYARADLLEAIAHWAVEHGEDAFLAGVIYAVRGPVR